MVYLVVFGVLIFCAVKSYYGKRLSIFVQTFADSCHANLIRNVLCSVIGLVILFFTANPTERLPELGMLLTCLLSAVSNVCSILFWVLAVHSNSMVALDVSSTAASLLPAVLCAVCFGEALHLTKLAAFLLILLATVILAGYSRQIMNKPGIAGTVFLIVNVVGDGMANFSQQLYKYYYTPAGGLFTGTAYPKTVFHFYTFFFSAVLLLAVAVVLLILRKKSASPAPAVQANRLPGRAIFCIAVMAVCMYLVNYLTTVATDNYAMPSQILYPLLKGGSLVFTNLIAMTFFGEKPTKRSLIACGLALVGIVLLNIV